MAEPVARCGLYTRLLRRHPDQDQGQKLRAQEGDRIPPLSIHKLLSAVEQECRKATKRSVGRARRYGRVVQLTTVRQLARNLRGDGGRP